MIKYDPPPILTACSYSCAIDDGEEVVLTGGYGCSASYCSGKDWTELTTVTRYNMQGQATTLPSLNTARGEHACGSFKKADGAKVREPVKKC